MSVATTPTVDVRAALAQPPTCELSVVIVSHNVAEFLRQCLRSLRQALAGIDAEVLVVDNASEDDTVTRLSAEFPEVHWIALPANIGFGKANNIGIAQARGRYILLLNPDTLVHPNALRTLLDYMAHHPEVGIAGCRVLNADGTFQETCRRGFPTPWVSFTRLFGLERLAPRSRLFARYAQRFRPEDEVGYAEVISGAFMLCRRELLQELGGFDPEYFLYGEDVDLCYRAHRAGWRIGYVGTATVVHFKGESARRTTTDVIHHFYDAMRIFVRQYYGRSPIAPLLYLGIGLRKLLARAVQFPNLWMLGIADLLGALGALMVATWLRFGSLFGLRPYAYPTVFIVVGGLIFGLMLLFGDYLERRVRLSRALLVYALAFFALASLTYFFKDYAFSRWVVLGTAAGTALWGMGVRLAVQLRRWLRQSMAPRRVAILGTGEVARKVAATLSEGVAGLPGVVVVGFVQYGIRAEADSGLPVLGESSELPAIVERWRIQELVAAEPDLPPGELVNIVERLARWRVRLYIVHHPEELYVQRFVGELLGQEPMWQRYPLLHPRLRLLKRCVDILVASGALLFGLALVFLRPRRKDFLRRWWNVLRGWWSVVGLYPLEGTAGEAGFGKPGITGLAHLSGGASLPKNVLQQLNNYYLRHASFALDLEIMLNYLVRRFRRETRAGL
ncbi:MAG: glycosyltransferase [Candidatus Kapabacteria bacterium]|nr:glycosyltransferase [Candidatus Kapabacteria bacterium]MDW8012407.1 glycosyltransferase [Bacteroidota bacterium]